MTKVKIEPSAEDAVEEKESWDVLVTRINQIASPLASRKLTKKVYKVIKKGKVGDNRRTCHAHGHPWC